MFLFARVLPLMKVKISVKLDHIWGSKGPKTPKKGYFMDAD